MVLASEKVYVFKKEGRVDAKHILLGSDIQSLSRCDGTLTITIYTQGKDIFPLVFECKRDLADWWFSLLILLAQERGRTLPLFVVRVCTRSEWWGSEAYVTAGQIRVLMGRGGGGGGGGGGNNGASVQSQVQDQSPREQVIPSI